MELKKRTLTIIASVFIAIIFLTGAGVFVVMNFYDQKNAIAVIQKQLHALSSSDYESAYIMTSRDFQKSISFDTFKSFANENTVLHANANSTFYDGSINDGYFAVKAVFTSKSGESRKFEYTLVREGGKWVILNIRLKANDAGITVPRVSSNKSINDLSKHSGINLTNKFTNKNSGYEIQYPGNWVSKQPDATTVVIGGKQGTKSYDSSVNIQTVLTKESGGTFITPQQLLDNLKKQAQSLAKNTQFYIEDSIELDKRPDRPAMKGLYTELTFTNNGKKYQQLVFVFLRPDNKAFYVWSFTAPVFMFNTDYPVAKAMFSSWSIK